MVLTYSFYERDTTTVAKELLGCYVVHETKEGKLVGKIVETEAYLGSKDPAAHSFNGKTKRTEVMFGPAGRAYIYFIYGMYWCLNVVTQKEGIGEAVLIRALEPREGIELMKRRRNKENVHELCNGPGKLVLAMGIGKELNGTSFVDGPLKIFSAEKKLHERNIVATKRVGITKAADLPLRFYLKDSPFVSRK